MITVVIVENETITRRGIIETIDWALMNCVVIGEASNGEEGLNLINELKPDLVITDVRMPYMDGITMISNLQNRCCTSNFILLTAHSDFDYIQKAMRAGASDYLVKPIKDNELENAIKRIFDNNNPNSTIDQPNKSQVAFDFNPSKSYSNKYVQSAVNYIKTNYKDDININDIAYFLDISCGYLSRIFKRETNYTLTNYLCYYRVKLSCALLENCRAKIYEVANEVGYEDTAYFSTLFKKIVGISPSEYQSTIITQSNK